MLRIRPVTCRISALSREQPCHGVIGKDNLLYRSNKSGSVYVFLPLFMTTMPQKPAFCQWVAPCRPAPCA
ncbi:hypothetical protein KL86DES1_21847 [uncultured Desulfovibrio sp.]|uniref:Uncharacterized protein n=1 Tax=uncultured Desulfovibrio sp. TaxID=167968 RepID=A0A212L9V3_9BACT|nr:hypothetical protein KL86DES1_21847 [uncultured Desulfovibrio sp.]VZH34743.1 conserved protein of unknown function [Desulfovibrio sp. 86]